MILPLLKGFEMNRRLSSLVSTSPGQEATAKKSLVVRELAGEDVSLVAIYLLNQ
jgi:hypothetical protein